MSASEKCLGYDAFGALLPGRNYSSDSYRFGFNGKENDNEVHGATGTSQDFGARIYDNRVARFLSLDPYTDKNPTFSAYAFADDSPIMFIDHDGLFRMSARLQRKYPMLTNVMKNIQQAVHSRPEVFEAFRDNLGLTDAQANEMLQWGKGPKVKVKDFGEKYYADTRMKVSLNKRMVQMLEGKRANNMTDTQEGLFAQVFITSTHEAQHYAENSLGIYVYDCDFYDALDPEHEGGFQFELKAFGAIAKTKWDNESGFSDYPSINVDDFARDYSGMISILKGVGGQETNQEAPQKNFDFKRDVVRQAPDGL